MAKYRMIRTFMVVGLLSFFFSASAAEPLKQDSGPNGLISVEAEHYDALIGHAPHYWKLVSQASNSFIPPDGFSGGSAMQSQPATSGSTVAFEGSDYPERSAALNFQVDFVKTGIHYVWILGYGMDGTSDSCHVNLNGLPNTTAHRISDSWSDNYGWGRVMMDSAGVATIEVSHAGVHTLGVWMREDGFVVDKIVLTTNPSFVPTEHGPPESLRLNIRASEPYPSHEARDVIPDVVLHWTPGGTVATHSVYLSTDFNEVNDADVSVLVSPSQEVNTFDPEGHLILGETYYWRVDEVNGAPDFSVHAGEVWQFTAEAVSYPIQLAYITTGASSFAQATEDPHNTLNGSGLNPAGQHSYLRSDMWLTQASDTQKWIHYHFDRMYELDKLHIWNHNSSAEQVLGYGMREILIAYSLDGTTWIDVPSVELPQAPGDEFYIGDDVPLSSVLVQDLRITALSNWSQLGVVQTGLSEVAIYTRPTYAWSHTPALGADPVSPHHLSLAWRKGREAQQHEVYFGTSPDSLLLIATQPATHSLADLDISQRVMLDQTYYWQITEVNENADIARWEGPTVHFKTSDHLLIDDMESYRGTDGHRIWQTWVDGYDDPALNGAVVGHENLPENKRVHSPYFSMPFFYDNTTAPLSKTIRTFDRPDDITDWTHYGVTKLVLYTYGLPGNTDAQPYIEINGVKALLDKAALTTTEWKPYAIDLTSMDTDLSDIKSLAIGVDSDGTKGLFYIDDIALYKDLPVTEEP